MKQILIIILSILYSLSVPANGQSAHCSNCGQCQNYKLSEKIKYSKADVEIFNNWVDELKDYKNSSIAEIMILTAKQRLGTPYVAGTLEIGDSTESLIVNLHETDCILFAESCIAFALTLKSDDISFEHFCNTICRLRYRNGEINGYASRLHYTSEWIAQGVKNNFFKDMSKEIAGKIVPQKLSYMTTHSDSYRQLANSPENVEKMKAIENTLNQMTFYYIPKNEVEKNLKKLQSGDIVGFNVRNEGIDIGHVGIIYIDERNTVRFIHASMKEKKVVIEKKSLLEYINGSASNNGIRIVRPVQ